MQHPAAAIQILARHLSIFAGSFSLEGIKAVCAESQINQADIVVCLEQLVTAHDIQVEQTDTGTRYRMADEARQAARSQLSAEETIRAFTGLVNYCIDVARHSLDETLGPQRAMWMQRLEQEHPNIRVVLDWLVQRAEVERGLELASLLAELWFEDQHTTEGRDWFVKLLALPQADALPAQRASALDLAGALALNQGDNKTARRLKEEGLAILQKLGDPVRLGYALVHLGHLIGYSHQDYSEAAQIYRQALDSFRGANHAEGMAHATANLGTVMLLMGDYLRARPLLAESLQIYRDLRYGYDLALSLRRVAGVAAAMGQAERAMRLAGAGAAHGAVIGLVLPPVLEEKYERVLAPARSKLSETEQAVLWAEGKALTMDQAVDYAFEVLSTKTDAEKS